jgi:hypothetical protein
MKKIYQAFKAEAMRGKDPDNKTKKIRSEQAGRNKLVYAYSLRDHCELFLGQTDRQTDRQTGKDGNKRTKGCAGLVYRRIMNSQ